MQFRKYIKWDAQEWWSIEPSTYAHLDQNSACQDTFYGLETHHPTMERYLEFQTQHARFPVNTVKNNI